MQQTQQAIARRDDEEWLKRRAPILEVNPPYPPQEGCYNYRHAEKTRLDVWTSDCTGSLWFLHALSGLQVLAILALE